jgi:hypothetical protein
VDREECGVAALISACRTPTAITTSTKRRRTRRTLERIPRYLKTTGLRVGLLMNFNSTLLKNGLKQIVR